MAQAKKRKKFFDVDIPIAGKGTHVQAYSIEEIDGRHIRYDLTRVLRGKSVEVQLIIKVKGEKATAYPKKITLMPYYLKRMVRKGTSYIEDSFSADCKDARVKIKPLLVARRKISRAVKKALREKAREELTSYIKNKTVEEIFEEIVKNQLQKPLSLKLKKIYPLSLCEIRVFKIEEMKEPSKKDTEKSSKKEEKKE